MLLLDFFIRCLFFFFLANDWYSSFAFHILSSTSTWWLWWNRGFFFGLIWNFMSLCCTCLWLVLYYRLSIHKLLKVIFLRTQKHFFVFIILTGWRFKLWRYNIILWIPFSNDTSRVRFMMFVLSVMWSKNRRFISKVKLWLTGTNDIASLNLNFSNTYKWLSFVFTLNQELSKLYVVLNISIFII